MKRVLLTVRGVVQGVGYRFFARNAGRRAGVRGFVRNMPDGSVQAEAQGEEKQIAAFISELRIGPPSSHVAALDLREIDTVEGEKWFDVRF